jgi:TolB-like protein/DNA-binding winged helix-turn-helix (wHTH) protein/Tfp pilus assembly protein PilF
MTQPGERELYRIGELTLDVDARLLTRAGELVPLPPKTFELFVELVRRAPGVVRRQELMDTVWAHELVNDEALTQRVMLLRRTLGDDPRKPRFIASAPRWGYRLVAPVERVATQATPPPAPAQSPRDDTQVARLEVGKAISGRWYRWPVWAAVALAAAVVIASVFYLLLGHGRRAIESLAIAPFAAADSGTDTEVLCTGIPATLTATLAQVPDMRVIAASTMARYRGRTIDPQVIGRQLAVRAVLTGTLVQRGNVVAIDAELVDTEDGSRLWGAHFERPVADIFAVQDEISREIARGMRLRLTGEEQNRLARRSTENFEAYTLYLKGRYFWNKRNEKGFEDAIACFRAAIELDPAYALAYTGLADCYALEGSMEYGIAPPTAAMPKARAAAAKALELDPEQAEAHATLGLVLWEYDWKRNDAEHELRRAIQLSPGYATAHQWLAEVLAELGRADEAWREIQRAQEIDPLSLTIATDLGLLSYYQRDYERAVTYLQAVLGMDPAFTQASLALGLTYLQQGEDAKAVDVLQAADRSVGGAPSTMAALGFACARAGRTAEAHALLDALLVASREHYVPSYYIAALHLGLGDRDRAFEWLDRACTERCDMLGTLKVEPGFDPIRADPRFASLLRCVNLFE